MEEDKVGSIEYLLNRCGGSGGVRHINGRRYYEVEDFWWSSNKPDWVKQTVQKWKSLGYYACSTYTVVRSGTSWNNSPNDMKKYAVFVAVKD